MPDACDLHEDSPSHAPNYEGLTTVPSRGSSDELERRVAAMEKKINDDLKPLLVNFEIDRAVDAFVEATDDGKVLRQAYRSDIRATKTQRKRHRDDVPTEIGQTQLEDLTASPVMFDNDLTAWLMESLRVERCEVAQVLQTRHLKLLADWSRNATHVQDTVFGNTSPSVPITPRAKAPTAPRDTSINDRQPKENATSVGDIWTVARPPLRDVDGRVFVQEPAPRQEGAGHRLSSSTRSSTVEEEKLSSFQATGSQIDAMRTSEAVTETVKIINQHKPRQSFASDNSKEMFVQMSSGNASFNLRAVDRLVSNARFELFFGVLIVLSSFALAVQIQYEGFQTGYEEDFPSCSKPAAQRWPGAEKVLSISQFIFGICFVLEVVLKMLGRRIDFLKSMWNWFDTFVVLCWILYESEVVAMTNPAILRMLRIARLFRMVRLFRTFAAFDMLQLIVGSIQASVMVMLWSLVYLSLLMMTAAMLMNSILVEYISADDSKEKYEVYMHFGTFTRSMFTMWEITLGNWVPVGHLLVDNVSEWFVLFFLLWRGIVSFAMVTTIRGVFLHETFKAADADEELMIMQKQRMLQKTRCHMLSFFAKVDASGDGFITLEEVHMLAKDPRMKAWIAAMDMDFTDVEKVFAMMDDGDGYLSVDELLTGITRLKGTAKSLDICHLAHKVSRIEKCVIRIHSLVGGPELASQMSRQL